MIQEPCTLSVQKIADILKVNLSQGLDSKTIKEHFYKYGPNIIQQDEPRHPWRILGNQFLNPIIYILVFAAILAFLFGDGLEGSAILIVILISVAIGFFMELRAVRSLQALRKLGQVTMRIVRSGKTRQIKSSGLVPGDIMLLQPGDFISADARLISQENLSVKESMLTGESTPVPKNTHLLPKGTPITDQNNMLFKGTMVMTGFGRAIVVATGESTQLGKIQQMGMSTKKEHAPFEKKLNQLSKWLIWLTLIFAVLIIVVGYLRGRDIILMIETGVALAVAAIPEGLPIVATIALAQGMLRLAKKKVVVKKLEAVQTLGATDIIFTDKTGTLTEDKMKVQSIITSEGEFFGAGESGTDFSFNGKPTIFDTIMRASILCNNEKLSTEDLAGDSIERALIDFARQQGYDIDDIRQTNPERMELPFDADRKLMATAHKGKNGFLVYVKGAYESLLPHCDAILANAETRSFEDKEEWNGRVNNLAEQGLRTLAFATNVVNKLPKDKEDLVKNLTFLGVMGFLDSARKDVRPIMDIYKKAGIRVVMVTGDHPSTSKKIAEEVGILEQGAKDRVIHGEELILLQDGNEVASAKILKALVFARVTPKQKLDLISMHQANGHIVGMIGDGINDVPALKKADIGIAMGIRGTEAAREVADVILKNDKFATIELGIRQGRVIFENIRQFVVYLLSCNLAEILSVGVAALLNLPSPLLPLQILFLNMVTDVFPALALGLGKGDPDVMEKSPRNPENPIIDKDDWKDTILYGLSISLVVLGVVVYAEYIMEVSSDIINNMAFFTLLLAQLLNVFNIPKVGQSFFYNEVTRNLWVWMALLFSLAITFLAYFTPSISTALAFVALSLDQFIIAALFALTALLIVQPIKRLGSLFHRHKSK
ncbi:HAD-IC family P-type ATPase [Muricauda sp. JGD-17]|uniref:HAD-IC family P-type ATPase n=1 Tax=Flagellimonas ochracea TaxID=2696472 RepID=A0A964TAN1_9FLAO|nr:cation-transporting P-type ATPase [Allomuricauda ochracea]NAY91362.1 HAD-IC family P-type ATPase [Allomuricauda ochracea]